jgi:hypothetical protein
MWFESDQSGADVSHRIPGNAQNKAQLSLQSQSLPLCGFALALLTPLQNLGAP